MLIARYKLILFDAGGTLLYPYPSVGQIYQEVAEKYDCVADATHLNQLFREVWKKHDGIASLKSHSDEKIERKFWRTLVSEVFEQVGEVSDFEAFFNELFDLFATAHCWRVYPEALEVLTEVKKQGKQMGIVSNWDSRLHRLCDQFDLAPHFDFILASAVFGASKPSPKIFEEALRRSGVQPSEALHIGDSLADDVKGAQTAGIHAVLLDRHHEAKPGEGHTPEGTLVVHDLMALIQKM